MKNKSLISLIVFSALLITALFNSVSTSSNSKVDKNSCTYKGRKLYGKVKVVKSFPI